MLVPPIQGEHIGNLTNVPQGIQPVHFFGYHFFNPNAVTAFIQIFNLPASDVNPGVTTPTYVIPVPATVGATSPGVAQIQWVRPLLFNLSISIIATTTATGGVALGLPCDAILFVDEE